MKGVFLMFFDADSVLPSVVSIWELIVTQYQLPLFVAILAVTALVGKFVSIIIRRWLYGELSDIDKR